MKLHTVACGTGLTVAGVEEADPGDRDLVVDREPGHRVARRFSELLDEPLARSLDLFLERAHPGGDRRLRACWCRGDLRDHRGRAFLQDQVEIRVRLTASLDERRRDFVDGALDARVAWLVGIARVGD